MENHAAEKKQEVRVFVGGLASDWEDDTFFNVMCHFGTVLSAHIKRYPNGMSKRFGFAVLINVKNLKKLYGHHFIDGGKEIEIQEHRRQNSLLLCYSPESGLSEGDIMSWLKSRGYSITSIDKHYRRGPNGYPRATFEEDSCISNLLQQGFVYIKNVRVEFLNKSSERRLGFRNQQGSGYDYSGPYPQEGHNLIYDQDSHFNHSGPEQYSHFGPEDYSSPAFVEEGYGNKHIAAPANRKPQVSAKTITSKRNPVQSPQNTLDTDPSYQSIADPQVSKAPHRSSKHEFSITEPTYSGSEQRSLQVIKPRGSETPSSTNQLKEMKNTRKETATTDISAKNSMSSLSFPVSLSDFSSDLQMVGQEQHSRPLKSGTPVQSQAAAAEGGTGSFAKTPSSRTRGQLSSKNTSDFYPNGPHAPIPFTSEAVFESNSLKTTPWLAQTQMVATNGISMWPLPGEFLQPDLATTQNLGLMMRPFAYTHPTGGQQFAAQAFLEESLSPLEPAKRREWSISYYAFPGLV